MTIFEPNPSHESPLESPQSAHSDEEDSREWTKTRIAYAAAWGAYGALFGALGWVLTDPQHVAGGLVMALGCVMIITSVVIGTRHGPNQDLDYEPIECGDLNGGKGR